MLNQPIYLYGPPGSGKSLVGALLAEQLCRPFIDLDAEIEKRIGSSIADFFQKQGENAFRIVELDMLREFSTSKNGLVIALGGGALLGQENEQVARQSGQIVCLTAEYETLKQHLERENRKRPLLQGDLEPRLKELLLKRADHYRKFLTQPVDGLSPLEVASAIQIRLGRFFVSGMGAGYPVIVQEGLLKQVGETLSQFGLKGPLALVTDQNVGKYYLDPVKQSLHAAGYRVAEMEIPAGERHKNMTCVLQLWDQFLAAGLERGSMVLALGGGVVTDLAGFAASAYLRGVPWAACPTSLLGMVDASLGGKTGVDLPQGKNLVGAFCPPKLILTDPLCLQSLPREELRNGMAEVLKHGVISSVEIFNICLQENWEQELSSLLPKAMAAKIQFLSVDPYEKGIRAVLNFGHTIGHALELVSGYQLRHGEAVGLGMLWEAKIALELGLCKADLPAAIRRALKNLGLPVVLSEPYPLEAVLAAMQTDKKRADGKVKFVLPHQIGQVSHGHEVGVDLLRRVLRDEMAR